MYLPYIDLTVLDCRYNGSSQCITVQDYNTTVRRTIERITNGVVTPDALRTNGLTYEDLGLPKMDMFERIDMLRETNGRIESIKRDLETPAPVTPPETPPVTPPETSNPE